MKLTKLFHEFSESEKSGGLVLILCTIASLICANLGFGDAYKHFWHSALWGQNVEYWINDGLMTIFFLLIGLELEREVYIGELSKLKDALLPIFAALGGMLIPAGIYMLLNQDPLTKDGAGVPMATDIAFALGVLSLLGNKVPATLKVFLTALAVIDDLGAILVIAIFYAKGIVLTNLLISLGIFVLLLILNRAKVRNLIPYLVGGVLMWYFMLHSGVHATITGVLLAFAIPFGNGDEKSTSYLLQKHLHKPVAFVILPLFALANTAISFSGSFAEILALNYSLGILLGLVVGKPLGIFLLSFIAVSIKLCQLPEGLGWKPIIGAGMLGGIGFTMSIFITLLAFEDNTIINNAKLVILTASLIAGLLGFFFLRAALNSKKSIA